MKIIQTIHLQGFLNNGYDGIVLNDEYDSVADNIAKLIDIDTELSKHQEEDGYQTVNSLYIPKVSLKMYLSDKEVTIEEATEKVILNALGALDIYTEWYGYSEWTIEGYSVDNFTIGNHDLEEILSNYIGKYVHIIMEVLE